MVVAMSIGYASTALSPLERTRRVSPAELYNATTLASGDEFQMNSWRTAENLSKGKFREFTF